MATRSLIARDAGGTIEFIYCHWDGYPKHVGKTLETYYSTDDKVDALMKLGDLSSLHDSPECPEGHSFDNPVEGFCVAYGHDRGESNAQAKFRKGLSALRDYADDAGAEYVYLYVNGVWTGCSTDGKYAGEFFSVDRMIELGVE